MPEMEFLKTSIEDRISLISNYFYLGWKYNNTKNMIKNKIHYLAKQVSYHKN